MSIENTENTMNAMKMMNTENTMNIMNMMNTHRGAALSVRVQPLAEACLVERRSGTTDRKLPMATPAMRMTSAKNELST